MVTVQTYQSALKIAEYVNRPKPLAFDLMVKEYLEFTEFTACDKPIFQAVGSGRKPSADCHSQSVDAERKADNLVRAQRRARSALRDYALSNRFDIFVTLTLDKEKIDRYDMSVIVKRLNIWLDNNVRRKGLRYVLVPELHKDGAVHFHGLFNDCLAKEDSGHSTADGRTVYNLPSWDYGFTTAIPLTGDYSQVVTYVSKYVTKQTEKVGGRWYYSGGELGKPIKRYTNLADFDGIADSGESFTNKDGSLHFIRWRAKN